MDTRQVFDLLAGDPGGSGDPDGNSQHGQIGESAGGTSRYKTFGEPLDEHGWDTAGARTQAEQATIDQAIDQAIRQGGVLAAKKGTAGALLLNALTTPTVDWKTQLAEFVRTTTAGRDDSTWRKPNRRWMAQGVYMPSTYSEAVGEIIVALDTSGSVGSDELAAFGSELSGICTQTNPSKVTLLWWDTKVASVQEFVQGEYEGMASALKPKGGGGTEFGAVLDWVRSKNITPACMVVLTDGYFDFPAAPPYPVLFGMSTSVAAPWGVTIRVDAR